jgi:HTH-type transcriptional regulator/antitoxin HigA
MQIKKPEIVKTNKINSQKGYHEAMKRVEKLLQKSTKSGGFKNLPASDVKAFQDLSLMAEKYEDGIPLMPIKTPTTLVEMIRYKMFEMNLKQKQLATILEISETRISELLTGKRKINIELAKKLHAKLHIDAHFILEAA